MLNQLEIAGLSRLLENREKTERVIFSFSKLTKLEIAKMSRNECFKTLILLVQQMEIETKRNFWTSAL